MKRLMVSMDRRAGDSGTPARDPVGRTEERAGLREMETRQTLTSNAGFGDVLEPSPGDQDQPGGGFEACRGRRTLEELTGGRETDTPHGKLFEVAQSFRNGYRHGKYLLDEFGSKDLCMLDLFCRGAGAMNGGPRCFQPEDFLFLDIETTGLSLGTGTYVFLVGIGYFRDRKYHVRQFLLRRFPEEACFLANLKDWLEGCGVLVTYNGKRFDLPVLDTRFSMCGMTLAADRKPHWDLLYPSRRLWQDRVEDCRLGTLEETQLGVDRGMEDIPGSRIPGVYFGYVHGGETRDLDRVLYHNAMDVLSLATLAVHMGRCLGEKDPEGVNLLRMGRFFDKVGMGGLGRECYEIASGCGALPEVREDALFRLAMTMKRDGARKDAVEILEGVVKRGGARLVDSCEEIAKFYEHDLRDIDKAMGFVRLALESLSPDDQRRSDRLHRRLGRLQRKRGTD